MSTSAPRPFNLPKRTSPRTWRNVGFVPQAAVSRCNENDWRLRRGRAAVSQSSPLWKPEDPIADQNDRKFHRSIDQ